MSEMDQRLLEPSPKYTARYLVPEKLHSLTDEHIHTIKESFDLPAQTNEEFRTEIDRWRYRWGQVPANKPSDIAQTLDITNQLLYPNIYGALVISLTLPVSIARAERSFSTMRRLKNYLRSTMTTDRLTGLALLNVYRHTYHISYDDVVNSFAAKKNRRMDLLFANQY